MAWSISTTSRPFDSERKVEAEGRRAHSTFTARNAKGEALGTVDGYDVRRLEYHSNVVAPDATGAVIVVAWFDEKETWCRRLPVVAWRINHDFRS